jgi:DNA-binding Xre family transcriptional regulator
MTYAALGHRLNLSEGSIERLFSTSSFTLRRLQQICDALEVDFCDVAKLARSQTATGTRRILRLLGIPFVVHPTDGNLIVSCAAAGSAVGESERGMQPDH